MQQPHIQLASSMAPSSEYSKSPTYEQVPFQECIHKSNLLLSPTKVA